MGLATGAVSQFESVMWSQISWKVIMMAAKTYEQLRDAPDSHLLFKEKEAAVTGRDFLQVHLVHQLCPILNWEIP